MNVVMIETRTGEDGTPWRAGLTYPSSTAFARGLIGAGYAYDADGDLPDVGLTQAQVTALGQGSIVSSTGAVYGLAEELPTPVRLTASGQVSAVAAEHRGFEVVSISGGPQTITVYDNTAGSGTVAKVYTVNATGFYYFDGDGTTPGNGTGGRRPMAAGVYAAISGGTSRSIDFF